MTAEAMARNTRHGRMWVPVADKYIGKALDFYGEYSWNEVEVFRQIVKPGMWALDIGANIGVFTLELSRLVGADGRVTAFEPQAMIFELLRTNCEANYVGNAMLVHAAVGAHAAKMAAPDVDYAVEGNFGGVEMGVGSATVPVVTLDGLNLPACHFIKLDVEGAEIEALTGGTKMIVRERPIIYVENDRKEKSPALISLLTELGYNMFWHLAPMFNPENFAGETEELWPGMVSVNMLCVPQEHRVALQGFPVVEGPDDRPEGLNE